jgi:hypothetical protein
VARYKAVYKDGDPPPGLQDFKYPVVAKLLKELKKEVAEYPSSS